MNNRADSLCPQAIEIKWANKKKIRARGVVSRSNRKPTGKYPSWKMNRMMHWESKHEYHAFLLLDANPGVMEFSEQPCEIQYILDGEKHRHYPDILVVTKSSRELWEIKEKVDAEHPEIARRTAFLTEHLLNLGYVYRVVLAESLAFEPQITNAKRLLKIGRKPVDFYIKERFRLRFKETKNITWKELSTKEFDSGRQTARLILEGYLTLAIEMSINAETLISMTSRLGCEL